MHVLLNGTSTELPDGATVATLVANLQLTGRRMAVEVNEEVIPKSEHAAFALKEGDKVEVVHAVGGG